MPLTLWMSLVAICAMGAVSPGPSLAVVLRHTLGGGRLPGVITGISHAAGVGLYALLTVWGLGELIERTPLLFRAISWGGALYLVWLGIQALRADRVGALEAHPTRTSRGQAARDGLLVALGNPKLILFFVALLSQFVTPEMSDAARLVIVLTAMLIDGGWYTLVAIGLSHSRLLPWLQAHAHWINRATGVMLLLIAARILWAATR
ncbi:MAG TPA: LysE family translocator [Halomonas sp.]|nr:LysE family translocator [Halomonas sp.]